jgi:hypothetical protein
MGATKLPQLGPCQVWYGTAGAEVELGKTKGVNWRLTEATAPITYDQTGTGPWDLVTVGKECQVDANFANLKYDLFEQLLPTEAEWYATGATPAAGPSNDALEIRLGLGTSFRDNAKRLILKPYVNGVPSSDTEDWIYFPLAFPSVDMDWGFNATDQRVIKCTFHCFPLSQSLPRICWLGAEAKLPVA